MSVVKVARLDLTRNRGKTTEAQRTRRFRRVHSTILHLRIAGVKFWIERDETEEGITQDLLDRGISKTDIVLAFYHLEDRKLTEFAIARTDRNPVSGMGLASGEIWGYN